MFDASDSLMSEPKSLAELAQLATEASPATPTAEAPSPAPLMDDVSAEVLAYLESGMSDEEEETPVPPRRSTYRPFNPDTILWPKTKKKDFRVGDLVWRIRHHHNVTMTRKVTRPPREEDFHKKGEEYYENHKYLEAGLYVIHKAKDPKRKNIALVRMVYDGREAMHKAFDEKVYKRELFPFEQDPKHIESVYNAVEESYHLYANLPEYKGYLKALKDQIQLVEDFSMDLCRYPKIEKLEYLLKGNIERLEYMAQWSPDCKARWDDIRERIKAEAWTFTWDRNKWEEEQAEKTRELESGGEDILNSSLGADKSEAEENELEQQPSIEITRLDPEKVLKFMGQKKMHERVKRIMVNKLVPNVRHQVLTGARSNPGNFLEMNITEIVENKNDFYLQAEKIMTRLYNKYKSHFKVANKHIDLDDNYRLRYVLQCLIPEAVIYYIQCRSPACKDRKMLDYEDAERRMIHPELFV